MSKTSHDYAADGVAAARSVLIELTHLLQEYRDDIVIVGGWVPELLAAGSPPHVGSMDVDLALDHRKLADAGYRSIRALLTDRGYYQMPNQRPFKYFRDVSLPSSSTPIVVEVDLLAGEYDGTGKRHSHQRIQEDLQPRKARGCELAFDVPAREVPVDGRLPGGAMDHVTVRVASIVPFLCMKGMAMAGRIKEKDAYDIVYCLDNYPGGWQAIALEFQPHLRHGLVREGLEHIKRGFESTESTGPAWYADFLEIADAEDRAIEMQRAYQLVTALFQALSAD
jgi:hypothetical protein